MENTEIKERNVMLGKILKKIFNWKSDAPPPDPEGTVTGMTVSGLPEGLTDAEFAERMNKKLEAIIKVRKSS